ncbi:hypothetical protein ACNTMW_31505 [Planosporangium sp. 12N6]|uniref:hypothetical protein n=1 Tax=Planosporangium spinosum TaxID=3402278 RepID=UPI003CECC28E
MHDDAHNQQPDHGFHLDPAGSATPGYGPPDPYGHQQPYVAAPHAAPVDSDAATAHGSAAAQPGGWPSGVPAPPAVKHRPWSTFLLTIQILGIVAASLLLAAGLVMLAAARGSSTSDARWVVLIGGILTVCGVILAAQTVPLLVCTVKGRRRADQGRPTMLFVVAVIGACWSGLGVLLVLSNVAAATANGGVFDPGRVLAGLVVNGLYLTVSVKTALASRQPRPPKQSTRTAGGVARG